MKRRNPLDQTAAAVVANASIVLRDRKAVLEKLLASQAPSGDADTARQNVSDAHRVLERAIRARDATIRKAA